MGAVSVMVDDFRKGPGPVASADATATDPAAGRLRVLVVDDNVDAANSLAMLLALVDDHDVQVAYDGLAAIEAAQAHRPDIFLLDLGMPGLSGFEVARRLRARAEFAHALIVALTGWGTERDRARTRESGFDEHLVKPVEPETIRAVMGRYRRPRTSSDVEAS